MSEVEPKVEPEAGSAYSLDALRSARKTAAERRSRVQRFYYLALSLTLLMLVFAPFVAWQFRGRSPVFVALPIIYALMLASLLPTYRFRIRDVEADIQEVDFQIDLQQYDVRLEERRAEKILRLNDFQLRRYYDLNLSQNYWVFTLGIVCILLGVVVIAATLYLVLAVATTFDTRVIVACLGGVGAFLTNFVAAIYLRMNVSATANLAEFHGRLVQTQEILLGNLVASRIANEKVRYQTLHELALAIIRNKQEREAPVPSRGTRRRNAAAAGPNPA